MTAETLAAIAAAETEARECIAGLPAGAFVQTRRWAEDRLRLCARDRAALERHAPVETWTDSVMELPDEASDALGNFYEPGETVAKQSAIYAEDGTLVAADDVETHCSHHVQTAPWPCPDAQAVIDYWQRETP